MEKGDKVITDHPDSRSRSLIRSYGIVQEITKGGSVVIKMADGSIINRHLNAIAVYVQPPENWQELYEQQVTFSEKNQQIFARRSNSKRQRKNTKRAIQSVNKSSSKTDNRAKL